MQSVINRVLAATTTSVAVDDDRRTPVDDPPGIKVDTTTTVAVNNTERRTLVDDDSSPPPVAAIDTTAAVPMTIATTAADIIVTAVAAASIAATPDDGSTTAITERHDDIIHQALYSPPIVAATAAATAVTNNSVIVDEHELVHINAAVMYAVQNMLCGNDVYIDNVNISQSSYKTMKTLYVRALDRLCMNSIATIGTAPSTMHRSQLSPPPSGIVAAAFAAADIDFASAIASPLPLSIPLVATPIDEQLTYYNDAAIEAVATIAASNVAATTTTDRRHSIATDEAVESLLALERMDVDHAAPVQNAMITEPELAAENVASATEHSIADESL